MPAALLNVAEEPFPSAPPATPTLPAYVETCPAGLILRIVKL